MMKKSGTGHPDEFLNEIIGNGVSFARIRRITGYFAHSKKLMRVQL